MKDHTALQCVLVPEVCSQLMMAEVVERETESTDDNGIRGQVSPGLLGPLELFTKDYTMSDLS